MTIKLSVDADETEIGLTGGPFIPLATVRCHANKDQLVANNPKCDDSDIFIKPSMILRQNGLTTPEQIIFLQNSTCLRDRVNNGMARK